VIARRIRLLLARLTLARRMEQQLPPAALSITSKLADAGHEVGLVGGCVRDLLLGRPPSDWDIVTSATQADLLILFPEGHAMGAARGGSTVLIPRGGQPFEVTPYRGGNLVADLQRRDFTINAMALGLDVTLHDPLGGQRDLVVGVVRACGDPGERFDEDPVRMLRAVRFAAQFDFTIDAGTVDAIRRLAPRLADVAAERIGSEFGRLLITPRPAWAMERLREYGLLSYMAPELQAIVDHALANVEPKLHLRLAVLLNGIGADLADGLLERLRFDNETRRRVVHLVRHHMDLHLTEPMSDGAIRQMVRRIGPAYINDLIQLRRADRGPATVALLEQIERVLAADSALHVRDLAIDGNDVMQVFTQAPGPVVGQILDQILDEVLAEPTQNNRPWLLQRLKRLKEEQHHDQE
jgi:tRNA nucleotidyltransferase/poly(A) polymerase